MIEQLNEEFVNAWIVRPQFVSRAAIDAAFATDEARVVARAILAAYTYPVDSMVVTAEGKVIAQLAVEELFKSFDPDEWTRKYQRMLEAGLAKEQ